MIDKRWKGLVPPTTAPVGKEFPAGNCDELLIVIALNMTYVYTIIYPTGLLSTENTIFLCCGRPSDDIAVEIRNGAFSLITASVNG